jgi:hypothetical protein
MNSFKPIGIALAATVLLSLASCNTTPPVPDNTQPSSNTTVETKQKINIVHFNPSGGLTGLLHAIDIDLYYAIIDYLIASGQDPSPRNIDRVYHAMRG